MNNKELIAELAQQCGLKQLDAQHLVNTMIDTMGDRLQEGDSIQLPNFGILEVRKKLERIIVNPATGQRMLVPPKLTISFKPATNLKEMVKKGGSTDE
jgi:DNA-binding protein HU-beta/integration host factor subunit alpha